MNTQTTKINSSTLLGDYVSGGRNPNWQLTCGFPMCHNFKEGYGSGGWCMIRNGTPSVSITGGCDHHTSNRATDGQ